MLFKPDYNLAEIKKLAQKPLPELLAETGKSGSRDYAFAACYSAAQTALGVTPFDEQIAAAFGLYKNKIVEMKTGEGKTLSAVFAAFLAHIENRKVHVFTFNDYLAKRDYNWMKPVYDLLGVSIALITESTPRAERKAAYRADVVYCTAKESGFDYLRDFIAYDLDDTVHDGFDFLIADEADSVLIDEARLPLVIACNMDVSGHDGLAEICGFVKSLEESEYGTDPAAKNVFLTDGGIKKAEEHFGVDNLYDEENYELLFNVNDCLKAVFLLKQDADYVVRDGKIQIIDEFTGRIAKNRIFPGKLQAAVETKHGLKATERGVVMGNIPVQFFTRCYKDTAGMTGTAASAEEEFELLYGLKIKNIQPRVPSKRIDNPFDLYFNRERKQRAIVAEAVRVHEKKQPLLIGTPTIEESERLAEELRQAGIDNLSVLNAKNDESEAEIIKNAGSAGAVTISTNMAGRGVDIKLGGFDEAGRDEVVKAGGLFIIGTSLRESRRMNNQLNGRCGRQGDVGETKLIIALDDEIMQKYNLKKLIPKNKYPKFTEEKITDKVVVREVERIQRIAEGSTLEERKRLLKFTMICEKHRSVIFSRRYKYLSGETEPNIWQKYAEGDYAKAVEKFGKDNEDKLNALQKEVILLKINELWSEYLIFTSELREGIHLRAVGGKSPSDEFNVDCEHYFEEMEERLIGNIAQCLEEILALDSIGDYKLNKPKSSWTYTLNESGSELVKKPILTAVFGEEETAEE